MKKKLYIIGIVVCMLIPLVLTAIFPTTSTSENRTLASFPSLMSDGNVNVNYLSELGDYFEDHFAFKNNLVGWDAKIYANLFQSSVQSKVIKGSGDWLYFKGSMDDYQGINLLSDRSLYNIAHNLSMMQGMCEAVGSHFYYVISPNKNTLYDDNMPYYYRKGETSNLQNLIPYLESENVHYIDLKDAFENQDEVLYLHGDSHWNNKGAVLAYNTILDAMNVDHDDLSDTDYTVRKDYQGDLNKMLYADEGPYEDQYYYDIDTNYEITSSSDDVEADVISATNSQGNGSLVMFRDSFGNTLFPLMANAFNTTYYTKLAPYDLSLITSHQPDYVVVERVERRISSIIEEVPVMQGSILRLNGYETVDSNSTINVSQDGDYTVIEGSVDSSLLETNSRIFVSVQSKGSEPVVAYEAFGCLEDGNDNGYKAYILNKNIPDDYTVNLFVLNEGKLFNIKVN